jgi:intein/homing endonuclease
MLKISELAKLPIPKKYKIVYWRLHLQKAGKIGGRNRFNTYGSVALDENYRKEKWREWWDMHGQYKKKAPGFQSIIKIKKPIKNKLLAEFVGIMLGDGGVNKYHTTITLSNKEKQYVFFVSKIINKLFNIKPKIYKLKYANAVDIVVNRKQLVDFCQKIGLVKGNKVKQQIDIPEWIKENRTFVRECIRGLVDTDGCFYMNSYIIGDKRYSYFKIAFTNASLPLVNSVAKALINFGIKARISRNKKDVRIEGSKYVLKYITEIGSHNFKHLQKIKAWKKSNNMLK